MKRNVIILLLVGSGIIVILLGTILGYLFLHRTSSQNNADLALDANKAFASIDKFAGQEQKAIEIVKNFRFTIPNTSIPSWRIE